MVTVDEETAVWVEKARSLGPLIEQYRDEGERERHLSVPVYEAIREMGFFKLWVPRALGGEEANIRTILEVTEEFARHDGAAAWNFCIGVQGGILLGFLPQERAAQMLEPDPNVTLGGSGQPNGRATPVEGGYRVTGRWPFLSGCHHTGWLGGNCMIMEDGEPRKLEDGAPELHMFFFSKDQYEIIDTWRTTGLRATGSHDIEVKDVFVPEDRKILGNMPKSPFQSSTLYQTKMALLLGPPLAAVGLGVAQRAIDAFVELAADKTPSRARRKLTDYDHVQMTMGKALAKVNSARVYLHHAMNDVLWPAMEAGQGDADEPAAEVFLSSVNAAHSAAEAVDMLQSAAGSSSMYEGNMIERCFRDAHMVTQHAGTAPSNYVRAGAFKLGLGYGTGR